MTTKATAIREQVEHTQILNKIERELEARVSSTMDKAVYDHAAATLANIEGASELERDDCELVLRRAQANVAHRNLIRQTQFLVTEPRWYANVVAQAAVTVGGFYAVEATRNWYKNRKNHEAFSETTPSSYKAPRTLRKESPVSAVS
jgi:hypothetical protein